ncbi:MAG: protein O-GlcNAc transferase, partial [Humisphaera sp.]|nr:protein O-GlcNAc transferase [Humisphaera sp.]
MDSGRQHEALQAAMEHHRHGRLAEAEAIYRRILADDPNQPDALNLLGTLAHQAGNADAGVKLISRAIAARPDAAEYHNNLAIALLALKRSDDAIAALRTAVKLRPDWAEAHYRLAYVLHDRGAYDAAIAEYQETLRLKPDLVEARNDLGTALRERGRLDDADAECRRVIELRPDLAEAHHNLANVLRDLGLLDEAIAAYRRALALNADMPITHSNLAYTLHFHPACDPAAIFEEHARWNDRFAKPLATAATATPHSNVHGDPDRPLRIGYVSPDFRNHPIGRFLSPIFANHDRERFTICCYNDVAAPDALTEQLRASADIWRETAALSDAQLHDLIRSDAIDILIDLTMHMKGNRLLVFARRPALVQATYLAYCSTTGLSAIDYRITDPLLDPPDAKQPFYAEKSVWLPETYWCYEP